MSPPDGLPNYGQRELSERERAEVILRLSKTRYRRFFETRSDGVIIFDADTAQVVNANTLIQKLLGYSREELIGKKFWDIAQLESVDAGMLAFTELQEKDRLHYVGLVLGARDGQHIEVEFVSNRYMVDQRRVIECNLVDISARKRAETALRLSELRYRRLFETAQDGILILDSGPGRIIDANPAIQRLLGYSLEELTTRTWWELGAPGEAHSFRLAFGEMQTRDQVRFEGMVLVSKDGRRIDVELSANAYHLDQRRVIQCHLRDITERKRAEADLRSLSRRLLTAEDGERRRIAKELHDSTAQDLVAVLMTLGDLRQGVTSGGGETASKAFEDSLAILENCTHEIRTLSYLLHPPRLDEAGLIGAIGHYAEGFGERTGIAMTVELQDDLGRLPEDVELVLFRVLQESLGNVHRHARSLAASVRLARDHNFTMLEIKDAGQGIPAGVLGPNGGLGKGAGVGIAGMRERLRQVGGSVEIQSAPGGTTVRAILPRSIENE